MFTVSAFNSSGKRFDIPGSYEDIKAAAKAVRQAPEYPQFVDVDLRGESEDEVEISATHQWDGYSFFDAT